MTFNQFQDLLSVNDLWVALNQVVSNYILQRQVYRNIKKCSNNTKEKNPHCKNRCVCPCMCPIHSKDTEHSLFSVTAVPWRTEQKTRLL